MQNIYWKNPVNTDQENFASNYYYNFLDTFKRTRPFGVPNGSFYFLFILLDALGGKAEFREHFYS